MARRSGTRNFTIPGVCITILGTICFIWAAGQWIDRNDWPPEETVRDLRQNECRTFRNLQSIVRAQEEYRKTDWDNDGKEVYATFFPHLWQSVDRSGNPIRVNLIPRKLAFAMEPVVAIDGYYFRDLHNRQSGQEGTLLRLDYRHEWAVTAIPDELRKTQPIFIADQSGRIFVGNTTIPWAYPHRPVENGWMEIDTVEGLREFQESADSPESPSGHRGSDPR